MCDSVFMSVCFHASVCSFKQRASVPRDSSTGAVSQNRENKLESQEEKSFMSDALITKTSRFSQTRVRWLIIWR